MDPMDYTMTDPHMNPSRPPNTASRCPYQQSQHSISGGLDSQARDGQHYDPVHDTNTWGFQSNRGANNPNISSRANFAAPHSIPQWEHGSFAPIHTYQGFGDVQQGIPSQALDPSVYSQQNGPMGFPMAPWGDARAFEPLPFGYGAFMEPPPPGNSNPPPDHPNGRNSARVSSAPAPDLLPPTYSAGEPRLNTSSNNAPPRLSPRQPGRLHASFHNVYTIPPYYTHRHVRMNSSNHLPDPTQRQSADAAAEGSNMNTPLSPASLEQRGAHQRPAGYSARMSSYLDPTSISRRRAMNALDSDDDDDADIDIESRQRDSDVYFNLQRDEQRALATMHRAIAASKKVPSKEAIASLEKVNLQDLQTSDQTCIICYNEFGVSNPEGVIESPLRLPKCKHVFGDKCIKKWFEENDSCPYCRDKLPSELSVRKSAALQSLQQQRQRMAAVEANRFRALHGFHTHAFSEDPGRSGTGLQHRSQDDYDYAISRAALSWGPSPPHRASPTDSPETRRRQSRGRIGGSRAARPTSVGSARFINPTMNHQNASQQAQVMGVASSNQGSHDRPV